MKMVVFDKDGTLTPYSLWGEVVYRVFSENLPLEHRSPEKREEILEAFCRTAGTTKDGNIHRRGFMFSRKNRRRAFLGLVLITLKYHLRPIASAKAVFRLKNRWQYGYREKLETCDLSGVRSTLDYLEGKDYSLALFSNDTIQSIQELQDALGKDYFPYIVHKDSSPKKPSPDIFRVYAESKGAGVSDIAFVTDTIEDLEMGRKAGVGCLIAIAGTLEKGDLSPYADIVISDIEELKTIF